MSQGSDFGVRSGQSPRPNPATQERKLAEESGVGVAPSLLPGWPLLRAKGQRVYSLNYQGGWQTTPRLWAGLLGASYIPGRDPD